MNEKNLLDQLKKSASDVTPPESLSPEAIEQLLTHMKHTSDAESQKIPDTPQNRILTAGRKKKKHFRWTRCAATAAVCVLCVSSAWQVNRIHQKSEQLEQTRARLIEAVTDDAAETELFTEEAAAHSEFDTTVPGITPAGSYEEIFEILHENFYYDESGFYPGLGARDIALYDSGSSDGTMAIAEGAEIMALEDGADIMYEEEDMAESADTAMAGSSSNTSVTTDSASADYSATNIQELGVDEADIVKTDGNYIYILRQDGSVTIVNADPDSLETLAVIEPADTAITSTQELYLDGNTLNIIANRHDTELIEDGDTYYTDTRDQTAVYTYDITDRSSPKLTGTITQDGYYRTSRKAGDYIYLFTSYYPNVQATFEESNFIPTVNDTRLAADDFYLPKQLNSSDYLLISSVDIRNPGEVLDKKALVSGTSNFYVSTENIYIANENYAADTTVTELMKFSYKDGIIKGVAAGSVKGYLNNSFSLNEYDGYLRVVSTYYDENWEERNALYILDAALNLTGSIENLAEGETIRSARFFKDTGYFVTFRQTDPLFSVDLSDPKAPVILGELKVTGFSSYLHFYGEDLLLGMGYEADENTGETYGVKLSMFDISDPANVTELHRIIIPDVTWCPSLDNYKSILINPEKNLFGFFCEDRYLVFSYDEETGFVSEFVYDLMEDALAQQTQIPDPETSAEGTELTGDTSASIDEAGTEPAVLDENMLLDDMGVDPAEDVLVDDTADATTDTMSSYDSSWYNTMNCSNTRGLYIGHVFYLAGSNSVLAFDMNDEFEKIGTLYF